MHMIILYVFLNYQPASYRIRVTQAFHRQLPRHARLSVCIAIIIDLPILVCGDESMHFVGLAQGSFLVLSFVALMSLMSMEEGRSSLNETPDWAVGLKLCGLYFLIYRQSTRTAE